MEIAKNKYGNGYVKAADGFYLSTFYPDPDELSLKQAETGTQLVRTHGKKTEVIAVLFEKRKRSQYRF